MVKYNPSPAALSRGLTIFALCPKSARIKTNNKLFTMPKIEPKIPSGFMELLPQEQIVFNEMLNKIRAIYELFGFSPIETPALEYSEILLAKGGGDTEKEIFRFGKGDNDYVMHFDLTIPLARYVAQHQNELIFPFRRYQIQKVWRAERPQKGRFREFFQCDADIIGSDSGLADAEIASLIWTVFTALGVPDFIIYINNRKILNGFFEELGITGQETIKILRVIDKLGKQDKEAVAAQLKELGLNEEKIVRLFDFLKTDFDREVLGYLESLKIENATFRQGLDEIKAAVKNIKILGVPRENCRINLSIARGLDYYTGTVYETFFKKPTPSSQPSICSGGRYDDLAQYYTDKKLPGVGISIGLTRLFSLLKDAGLIQATKASPARILVAPLEKQFQENCLALVAQLRKESISTEIFLGAEDLAKQLKYADRLKIPYVAMIGENETKENKVTLKNMASGEQELITPEEILKRIK